MYRNSKSTYFCKCLWILNWSKQILFVVDIPTQNLLTILLSIDHSSRCKLKVYIITNTKEKPSTINWFFSRKIGKPMKVKRVSKIWVRRSSTSIQFTLIQNLKSLVKTWSLNAGTSRLMPKRNLNLKFLTLNSPFCLLIREKKYSTWVAILSTLESMTPDETITCAPKWFILTLKWPRGVARDPRFVFRAFYYFRFRFFHRYFF